MKIRMELLSDAIFGNGMSVPGGEDISVLSDKYGFPYFKGTTLKGIFREEMQRYVMWTGNPLNVDMLLGKSGDDIYDDKIVFSDLVLSPAVRRTVVKEIGEDRPNETLDVLTNLRAFTSINENGVAEEGSLRLARCVNSGLVFYSEILCPPDLENDVEEILGLVKWIGTMRNRGFGKVRITKVEV